MELPNPPSKSALISLNAGSSSIRFALFRIDSHGQPAHAAGGRIEGIGTAPHLTAHTDAGSVAIDRRWTQLADDGASLGHEDVLGALLDWAFDHLAGDRVIGIGHRVVHGGTAFGGPCLIDGSVLTAIDALAPLAPLQQPHNAAAIRAAMRLAPHVPQVACFDTAFHRSRPALFNRFAVPRALHDAGVQRYGFHGLSYEFIAGELARLMPDSVGGRAVVAHLGNGASACAITQGRPVDTSMTFTPLDGLMMGTRSGTIDPAAVLHLITARGMTAAAVETMLSTQAGLLGVSGLSSDVRALEASDRPEAAEALALFAQRAAGEIARLATSQGGLETLVFTAGIGEHAVGLRRRIAEHLAWAGVQIDPAANAAPGSEARRISRPASAVETWVIPTDEEMMLARHTLAMVNHH